MRHCLLLDLVDDETLIAEYEAQHRRIWPEVAAHLRASGVLEMTIHRLGTRLVMILDVADDFSFEALAQAERDNPTIARWEAAMARYQRPTRWAPQGQKWTLARCIFALSEQP